MNLPRRKTSNNLYSYSIIKYGERKALRLKHGLHSVIFYQRGQYGNVGSNFRVKTRTNPTLDQPGDQG